MNTKINNIKKTLQSMQMKVVEVTKISDLFEEEFFKEKQLVYLPL